MPDIRLLLIEDNPRIQLANKDMLEIRGYAVDTASNLAEARAYLFERTPDAIVLDIMLPDGSGLDFLRELRQSSPVPVLMLTALGTTQDTIAGFAHGADDYLAKPYDCGELAARINALLRRAKWVPGKLDSGALALNVIGRQAFLDGQDLGLTGKEFACLLLLVQNEGKVLSAGSIYTGVWRMPLIGDSQAVRTVIARLRSKLSGSGFIIESLRGRGYSFIRE